MAGLMAHGLVRTQEQDLLNELRHRALAVADTMEGHLRAAVVEAATIAEAPAIARGDMREFYEYAKRAVGRQEIVTNAVLIDRNRQQLVNTLRPFSAGLPLSGTNVVDVFRTGEPTISDLFPGAVVGRKVIAVLAPVFVDGELRYAVSLGMPPESLARKLAGLQLPAGWISEVTDRAGSVVARSGAADGAVSLSASPAIQHEIERGCPLPFEWTNGAGESFAIACAPVPLAGWSVVVASPKELLFTPLKSSFMPLVVFAGVLLPIGAFLSLLFARRLARQVTILRTAALTVGSPQPWPAQASEIQEIDVIARALGDADALIKQREDERNKLLATVSQARDAAVAARAEAESANRAKSNFLAATSHDLRQPFQAMRLYYDVLCHQADARLVPTLERLGCAMASGEELLAAFLDLSVLDSQAVEVKPTFFSLQPSIDEIVTECALVADKAGLVLRHVPSRHVVYTDRLLLKRILRNLVVNALRYTSEGAVLIGCRRRGDSVVIQVVDTGQGIPKDQLDLIFEDFYQVGNLARARTHGLGIGLAVVSRLSRLLGHPVSVSSVVGKGSIFSIQLQSHGRAERVGVSLHEVALGDY